MKAIHGGKTKTHKIDANKLAALLRGGIPPQAYVRTDNASIRFVLPGSTKCRIDLSVRRNKATKTVTGIAAINVGEDGIGEFRFPKKRHINRQNLGHIRTQRIPQLLLQEVILSKSYRFFDFARTIAGSGASHKIGAPIPTGAALALIDSLP